MSSSLIETLENIRRQRDTSSLGRELRQFSRTNPEIKQEIVRYICNKTRIMYNNECDESTFWTFRGQRFRQLLYSYVYFGFNPEFLTEQQQEQQNIEYKYFMWINSTEPNTFFGSHISSSGSFSSDISSDISDISNDNTTSNTNYITANIRSTIRNSNRRGQVIIDPRYQRISNQANKYNELLKNNMFMQLFTKIKGTRLSNFKFNDEAKEKIYNFIYNESKKKIPSIRPFHDVIRETLHSLNLQVIASFMYYGYAPEFLSKEQHEENGLSQFYFLWQKEGDPNALKRPIGLEISNENFRKHKYWSNEQLNAYYFANILPDLLKRSDIKININNPIYKEELMIKEHDLKFLINDFMEGEQVLTDKEISYVKNNKTPPSFYWYIKRIIINKLILVKEIQNEIKKSLDTKLKSIVNKHYKSRNRFKWQNLCKPNELSALKMDELEELALQEKIPYYLMMTKRELCTEFAKRFQNVIKGKKKVEPKCINTTSILGTDLADIPPEFFFSYPSNNKIYCDDIRELHKHFEMNGNKNPIDRTPIKQSIVDTINEWYKYLTKISVNMLDFDDDPVILPIRSQLSAKFTTLASKLNYPNSSELFINADTVKLMLFIVELHKDGILSDSELRMLSGFTDINQRKLILIDTLLIKINNDPQRIEIPGQRDLLSAIAINTSNIYNQIFNNEH